MGNVNVYQKSIGKQRRVLNDVALYSARARAFYGGPASERQILEIDLVIDSDVDGILKT